MRLRSEGDIDRPDCQPGILRNDAFGEGCSNAGCSKGCWQMDTSCLIREAWKRWQWIISPPAPATAPAAGGPGELTRCSHPSYSVKCNLSNGRVSVERLDWNLVKQLGQALACSCPSSPWPVTACGKELASLGCHVMEGSLHLLGLFPPQKEQLGCHSLSHLDARFSCISLLLISTRALTSRFTQTSFHFRSVLLTT